MRSVFTFVPAFGQSVTAATFMTTHALQQRLAEKGIASSISTLSFPDIAELRSMVTTIWFDTMPQCDYLLFVDADMGFSPEIVLDMIMFDEPLIGAIYPQRKLPVSWAGSGTGTATTLRRGNFMEVEGVGFGCTLMHRSIIANMIKQMPELIDNRIDLHPAAPIMKGAGTNRIIRCFEKLDIPDRGLISEDLSFCIRHARCGGKVWGAIGYRISHVGPYDYAACYLEHVAQMEAQAQAQIAASQAAALAAPSLPVPLQQPMIIDMSKILPAPQAPVFAPSAVAAE